MFFFHIYTVHADRLTYGSLSFVIRALSQRAKTPRAASAAERKERCRRSETSCRAPPRCSALKVGVCVCLTLVCEILCKTSNFYFFFSLCRSEVSVEDLEVRYIISNIYDEAVKMTIIQQWRVVFFLKP